MSKLELLPSHPFVDAARKYIDVPYVHQGRDPQTGLDCVGIIRQALLDNGHNPPDLKAYSDRPTKEDKLTEMMTDYFGPFHPNLMVGDVVIVELSGLPHHLALVGNYFLGGFSLIHTRSDVRIDTTTRVTREWGAVREHRLNDKWRSMIIGGGYRL